MLEILAVILIHTAPFDEVVEAPRIPKKQKELSLKSGRVIVVNKIQFVGNEKVSTKELDNLTQIYLHTPISEADLMEIEDKIEEFYKEKGYKKVRVVIPAKQKRGVLTIHLDESALRGQPNTG